MMRTPSLCSSACIPGMDWDLQYSTCFVVEHTVPPAGSCHRSLRNVHRARYFHRRSCCWKFRRALWGGVRNVPGLPGVAVSPPRGFTPSRRLLGDVGHAYHDARRLRFPIHAPPPLQLVWVSLTSDEISSRMPSTAFSYSVALNYILTVVTLLWAILAQGFWWVRSGRLSRLCR